MITDTMVNINPDAHTLNIDPRVAMLSFSNFGSTPHPLSEKVMNAVDLILERRPDIVVDGEMQAVPP